LHACSREVKEYIYTESRKKPKFGLQLMNK